MDGVVVVYRATGDMNHLLFKRCEYFTDMLASYHNAWEDIWYQFLIDFPRITVYLDDQLVENAPDFYVACGLNKTMVMLCTQAAFYLPFTVVSSMYNRVDECMVTDCTLEGSVVRIQSGGTIELSQLFALKDLSDFTDLYHIQIRVELNLRDEYGSVSWELR